MWSGPAATGAGESLSAITADIARRLGVAARIPPMSDEPVRTIVETPDGALPFQHYFVREQCTPKVVASASRAPRPRSRPPPSRPRWRTAPEAVVICPSNPFISIDPILSIPGVRAALRRSKAPVVAVSPIVGGRAIKGPTAKMMAELGLPSGAVEVARHYDGLIDGFVLDSCDAESADAVKALGLAVHVTETVMQTLNDKTRLAREVLDFARSIASPADR